MEDNRVNISLIELLDDLDRKIDELNMFVHAADEKSKEKVLLIRNNAVKVLNNVKEKTVALSKEMNDEDEFLSVLASIKQRADSLNDEAVQKINNLINPQSEPVNEETRDDIIELIDDEDDKYPAFSKIEDVHSEVSARPEEEKNTGSVNEETEQQEQIVHSEVSKKVLEVLKGWLSPDMVKK